MSCKMLYFNYNDCAKIFFEKNKFYNFDIKFLKNNLTSTSVKNLNDEDLEYTNVLNIDSESKITSEVLEKFRNLRIIVTRTKDVKHIDLKSCLNRNIAVVNIEDYKKDSPLYNIKMSLKCATETLCGCKEYRII